VQAQLLSQFPFLFLYLPMFHKSQPAFGKFKADIPLWSVKTSQGLWRKYQRCFIQLPIFSQLYAPLFPLPSINSQLLTIPQMFAVKNKLQQSSIRAPGATDDELSSTAPSFFLIQEPRSIIYSIRLRIIPKHIGSPKLAREIYHRVKPTL
jgi:hypothetical protein